MKVAIIGATGYVGAELNRLLACHPNVEEIKNYSKIDDEADMADFYPSLPQDGAVSPMPAPEEMAGLADIYFTALPSGITLPYAEAIAASGGRLIDMGADFRFRDFSTYKQAYGCYESNALLEQAVYGLPELHRDAIKQAQIIGNPGCYPTSVILGTAPLFEAGFHPVMPVIADCKSGVTGAGQSLDRGNMFAECNENMRAYKPFVHRHVPEMKQELDAMNGSGVDVIFNPQLVPMNRGILSCIYFRLGELNEKAEAQIIEAYQAFAARERFISFSGRDVMPQPAWVRGSNNCHIGVSFDRATSMVLIVSTIDNLVKGAAGQAIQNMNLMFDIPEQTALENPGMYL